MSLQTKLKYGFFKNPELHINENGVKPQWSDLYMPELSDVIASAKDSSFDVLDDEGQTNNKRVVFFIQQTQDKVVIPEYQDKVDSITQRLNEADLDMSASNPYVDKKSKETRVSFIVHPMKGTSTLEQADY